MTYNRIESAKAMMEEARAGEVRWNREVAKIRRAAQVAAEKKAIVAQMDTARETTLTDEELTKGARL